MSNKNLNRSKIFSAILYDDDASHRLALEYITKNFNYAVIKHDRDVESIEDNTGEITLKKAHYHVVMKFENARYINGVASELNISANYIQVTRSIDNSLLYLIHFNDEDKFQYSINEVKGTLKDRLAKLVNTSGKSNTAILNEIRNFIITNPNIKYNDLLSYIFDMGYIDTFRAFHYVLKPLLKEFNICC